MIVKFFDEYFYQDTEIILEQKITFSNISKKVLP